ncbi:MAG: DJ-1/PfpI family protein [Candidatus Omnitrophica bacterium]|nr:DJ-1/PfpI family protein [Candidatus Omnitrophota bacterium]MCF7893445.1 DJ-1/PfpI family protein [Candidatus Omnitrophota bacterium]
MAKKAIILLAEGFEEIEAVTCVDILRRAGIQTTTIGVTNLIVGGSRRLELKTDMTISDLPLDYDAVILPGGMPGAENLAKSVQVTTLLKEADNQGKIIAAICAAPAVVFSPLGLLDSKTATCYPGLEENFSETTTHKTEKVVTDKNLITSQGPATALEFALKIVETLTNNELSQKIKKATLAE